MGQKFEFTVWKIWILIVNLVYFVSCLPAQPIRPRQLAKFGLRGLLNHTYMIDTVGKVLEPFLNHFFRSPAICVTKIQNFGSWELNELKKISGQIPITQNSSFGITDCCFLWTLVKNMVEKSPPKFDFKILLALNDF